jgi:hypothetical protein
MLFTPVVFGKQLRATPTELVIRDCGLRRLAPVKRKSQAAGRLRVTLVGSLGSDVITGVLIALEKVGLPVVPHEHDCLSHVSVSC